MATRKTNSSKTPNPASPPRFPVDAKVGDGTPGPGRRKGSRNKATVAGILAARDAFAHLGPVVIERIEKHYDLHPIPPESCATCRHYDTMVAEYVWGKPTQRHEFDVGELVKRLQRERGLDAKAANVIAIRAGVLVEGAA